MSSVSTTIAAHGHRPARRNTRVGNGFLGVIFFLCFEVVLFGSLIFAYLYLRRSLGTWPPPGIPRLEVVLPAINTVVLITSGFFCHYAYNGHQARPAGPVHGPAARTPQPCGGKLPCARTAFIWLHPATLL